MALAEEVRDICQKFGPAGWSDLFAAFGIDITLADPEALREELLRERSFSAAARRLPGFEDFALEGTRGITPAVPSQSLLYHAFASPNVRTRPDGTPLGAFPTLGELETLENFVYGAQPLSLNEILIRAGGGLAAIAVFATEYRSGIGTAHRRHADVCASRTGVARVGTIAPVYVPAFRGFVAHREGDGDHDIRVIPCRYAAYIAVQRRGDRNDFGPARFIEGQGPGDEFGPDDLRNFWVPVHKLFEGPDCVRGRNITLRLRPQHVNEKLRRIHQRDAGLPGFNSGWGPPEIESAPFTFKTGIAGWSNDPEHGPGLLVPDVHAGLVAELAFQGRDLSFNVPRHTPDSLSPSLTIESVGQFRSAPEYVHVRQRVLQNGGRRNLNDFSNVVGNVTRGNYRALHYADFTGDGWVTAETNLQQDLVRQIPAYSLITAPDFFPSVDQGALMDWWRERLPSAIRETIWQAPPPTTLSDIRRAPNLQLEDVDFRPEDDSVSTIVSPILPSGQGARRQARVPDALAGRSGSLPDAAAGVFQPGWDVSQDITPAGQPHLAGYGLGSPFPEDAKLCAAISTFWPAAAPDSSRQYAPQGQSNERGFATVCPLTDEEVGLQGAPSWDGVVGPKAVVQAGRELVEYTRFAYVDYVDQAMAGAFSLALTSKIDFAEYSNRILAMHRVFQAAGIGRREDWGVLSFRHAAAGDPERDAAESATGRPLGGRVFLFELYEAGRHQDHPSDHRKVRVRIRRRNRVPQRFQALTGSAERLVLIKLSQQPWQAVPVQ